MVKTRGLSTCRVTNDAVGSTSACPAWVALERKARWCDDPIQIKQWREIHRKETGQPSAMEHCARNEPVLQMVRACRMGARQPPHQDTGSSPGVPVLRVTQQPAQQPLSRSEAAQARKSSRQLAETAAGRPLLWNSTRTILRTSGLHSGGFSDRSHQVLPGHKQLFSVLTPNSCTHHYILF